MTGNYLDPIGPLILSFGIRRRQLWIKSDGPKSTRVWVLLAHHFSRCPPICLDLRIVSANKNGHQPKARNAPNSRFYFLKSLTFGVPKALINDQGSHFYNKTMFTVLEIYGVVHQVATTYHPQTNGQAEVFNREIKKLLQKMVNPNWNDWNRLLEDTLWAQRTTYRTPLGMSPYRIVFSKACHLLVEIEHQAYWATKKCNMAYDQAGKKGSFSCRNWRSFAWKPTRTPRSTRKRFHISVGVIPQGIARDIEKSLNRPIETQFESSWPSQLRPKASWPTEVPIQTKPSSLLFRYYPEKETKRNEMRGEQT
ncbi:Gag-Pol polyprotein, partial [Mucuna pruriens]